MFIFQQLKNDMQGSPIFGTELDPLSAMKEDILEPGKNCYK